MNSNERHRLPLLAFAAFLSSGCGGGASPLPEPIAPVAALDTLPAADAVAQDAEPEPELLAQARWEAPFAVSSTGRVVPRERRSVAIVGVDPAIAEAIEVLLVDVQDSGVGTEPEVERRGNRERDGDGRTRTAARGEGGGRDEVPRESGGPVVDDDSEEDGALAVRRVEREAAETAAPPPVRRGEPERSATHTVTRGDTWLGLARRYGISARQLAEANPGADPERIRIGQRLRIPEGAADESALATQVRTHRVGTGDTLWGIARRYDVSPEEIRSANRLPDDRVRLGQMLTIPDPD